KLLHGRIEPQRPFDVALGGARGRVIIIAGMDLVLADVVLERRYWDRFRIFLAGIPEQVEPVRNAIGERVDILIPRSVEIAAKQHVIVVDLGLASVTGGPLVALNDDPARKVNDAQPQQTCKRARSASRYRED